MYDVLINEFTITATSTTTTPNQILVHSVFVKFSATRTNMCISHISGENIRDVNQKCGKMLISSRFTINDSRNIHSFYVYIVLV